MSFIFIDDDYFATIFSVKKRTVGLLYAAKKFGDRINHFD